MPLNINKIYDKKRLKHDLMLGISNPSLVELNGINRVIGIPSNKRGPYC